MIDIFNDDAFSAVSMTKAINIMPYYPTMLGMMNLFNDRTDGVGDSTARFAATMANGIDTDTAIVYRKDGQLMLLPTEARGTMPTYNQPDPVGARSFKVPYIPKNDGLFWDAIIGKRIYGQPNNMGIGGSSQETVAMAIDRTLEKIWKEHLLTWEWHRLGAIKGVILDADGQQVVYDLFREFQIEGNGAGNGFIAKQVTYTADLGATCEEIVAHIGDAMGSTLAGPIKCLVGSDFFTKVSSDPTINTQFERWRDGEHLRTSYQNQTYQSMMPPGWVYKGVEFCRYRGSLTDQTTGVKQPYIANNKGHAFPTQTDRFCRFNAPGTVRDAVATNGLPIYVEREPKRFNQGIDFHTQSNPLMMCAQPEILVELTVA